MFVPKTQDDLKRIVEQRLEETTQLEFKRELPPSGKNDDLARDMAAIANTEGGVIIYGIEQDKNGRVERLNPFPIAGVAERVSLVRRRSTSQSRYHRPYQSLTLPFLTAGISSSKYLRASGHHISSRALP